MVSFLSSRDEEAHEGHWRHENEGLHRNRLSGTYMDVCAGAAQRGRWVSATRAGRDAELYDGLRFRAGGREGRVAMGDDVGERTRSPHQRGFASPASVRSLRRRVWP